MKEIMAALRSGIGKTPTRTMRLCLPLLSICAAFGANANAEDAAPTQPDIAIADQRPAAERASRGGSLSIYSCDFGVRQLGDGDLKFDRVASLRDALRISLGTRLSGTPLALSHYGIYINAHEILRRGAKAVVEHKIEVSGPVDPGMNCRKEEVHRGWYGPGELKTRNAAIVVEIGFVLDGVQHDVRTVYSPDHDPVRYRSAESAALVLEAAHQAEQAVVKELSR